MPEKKEVRKTKPIARDPTIAEEKERKKKMIKINLELGVKIMFERNYRF